MPQINLSVFPLLTVAFANFFLSWLYYSPAAPWFKAWQIGVGADPAKKEMSEEDKKAMPRLMGGAALSSLLFAFGLQVVVRGLGARGFVAGALVGILAWAGFVVSHSLNTQFEGRKPIVLIINNAHYLISYALFGGILAIWS